MESIDGGSMSPGERDRRLYFCIRYMGTCCSDGYLSWIRPTRYCYRRWRPWLPVLCILLLFGNLLWMVLSGKLQKFAISAPSSEMSYRSRNIRIPQYLLLDVDDNSQPKCKQIFENIVPHSARQHITDKNLVQSLFGKTFNSAYLTYSNSNEIIRIMEGRLCSNASNEWILFSILEKETLEKSTDENAYAMEALAEGPKRAHKCVSFDFAKCSLNNLQRDYPRLFQFDHEQHIKGIRTHENGMAIEIVYIVYHYIRRKAVDYENKLRRIYSSFSITIVPDLITSESVRIRVEMAKNNPLDRNIDCLATLPEKTFSRAYTFRMINPVIQFDQLAASTSYNICASCGGINKICKQFKTLSELKRSFQSSAGFLSKDALLVKLKHAVLITAAIIILSLIVTTSVVVWKSTSIFFYCRRVSRTIVSSTNEDNQDNVSIISNPIGNNNTNTNEEERSPYGTPRAPDTISVLTASGISVRETRGSISSIGSNV